MKATVWTSWNPRAETIEGGKPKCIFVGSIDFPPTAGDYVMVREGFGAEHVASVIHDLTTGDIEIQVVGCDPSNEYGPCLMAGKQ